MAKLRPTEVKFLLLVIQSISGRARIKSEFHLSPELSSQPYWPLLLLSKGELGVLGNSWVPRDLLPSCSPPSLAAFKACGQAEHKEQRSSDLIQGIKLIKTFYFHFENEQRSVKLIFKKWVLEVY